MTKIDDRKVVTGHGKYSGFTLYFLCIIIILNCFLFSTFSKASRKVKIIQFPQPEDIFNIKIRLPPSGTWRWRARRSFTSFSKIKIPDSSISSTWKPDVSSSLTSTQNSSSDETRDFFFFFRLSTTSLPCLTYIDHQTHNTIPFQESNCSSAKPS